MERKKQFSFSAILMFVGILFIVVAGGIFVSRTWHYLPESVKNLSMTVVTGGLFLGSWYAAEKTSLKKTATALYYLGICFTGFTAFALIGSFLANFYGCLTIALLSMSAPVMLRFYQKKHWFDGIFQMLLLDGTAVSICGYPLENALYSSMLTACVVTLLLALFARYCKIYLPDEKGLCTGALTFFGIHTCMLLPFLFVALTDSKNFLFTVLPAILITGALTVLYFTFRSRVLRIFQSLSFLYLSLSAVAFCMHNFYTELISDYIGELFFFAVFFLNLVWMVVLDRTEMFWINGIYAMISSLTQTFVFFFDNMWFQNRTSDIYFAYSLCLAIALILWKVLRKREMPWMPLSGYLGVLLLAEGNVFLSFLNQDYSLYYSLPVWFAVLFLQIAFFCRNSRIAQPLFRTLALLSGLTAVLGEKPILPTVFYAADGITEIADFSYEYVSVFLGLTIVLLGFIWYDYKKGIRIFQQISTCLLLAFMLFGNLIISELPNVLFLGISMLIMLIIASVLRQKMYAIASAVTLTLVALYLTRAFWLSITWWVYLFAAGVGLVIFAIKRERDEKRAEQA